MPGGTITTDKGMELHGYVAIKQAPPTRFYFATPHHAWERGTNENTNGLVRQYLPKYRTMTRVSQRASTAIAAKLNHRPRGSVLHFKVDVKWRSCWRRPVASAAAQPGGRGAE